MTVSAKVMGAHRPLQLTTGSRGVDSSSVSREEVVYPGMCGSTPLFAGRVGDWTWDTVSRLCGINVLTATDPTGQPAYLSFYYFRIRADRGFHPGILTFGDRLRISSRLFDFGSQSVLALHRIEKDGDGADGWIDHDEFYSGSGTGTIRVENLNRWISRHRPDSNKGLVRASPPDFSHTHLPRLPERYSPRAECRRARQELTFRTGELLSYEPVGEALNLDYPVDVTRDLNGVGLVYFAAYFAIVDRAIHRLWRKLGYGDDSFLRRTVLDHRLLYLGNSDFGAVLGVGVRCFQHPDTSTHQVYDVTITDRKDGRLLAISTVRLVAD